MLPDLAFRITAQAATAAAFAKTRSDIAGIRGEITTLGTQARAVFAGLATSIGIAGLMQIPRIIGDVAAKGAALQTTADKIGVTVEELQKLRYAGQQAEVEAGQIDEAFAKFSKNMADAARGGADDFRKALQLNGIALRDQDGKIRSVMDVAMDYANVIKNAANAQDRNILSTIAFGKANDELGQVFAGGAENIRKAGDELERINGITSSADIKKLADIDAAYDKLGATFGHFQDAAVVGGIDTLQSYADRMNTLGQAVDDFFANPNAENFLRLMFGDTFTEPKQTVNRSGKGDSATISGADFDARFGKPSVVPPVKQVKTDAERQAEKIQAVIDALVLEHDNLTRNARDQEIYNALARAGADINSDRGKQIAELAGQIYDETQAIDKNIATMDRMRDNSRAFLGDLKSGLREGQTFWQAFGNAAENALDRVLDRLLDVSTELALGKGGTGTGGFLTTLLSSLFGGGVLAGGARMGTGGIGHNAGGTNNWRGGPTWVGENGPEVLDLPGGSRITPNNALGGGRTEVVINNNTGESVQTRREKGPDLERIFVDIGSKAMASGAWDRSMRSRFGARPTKVSS